MDLTKNAPRRVQGSGGANEAPRRAKLKLPIGPAHLSQDLPASPTRPGNAKEVTRAEEKEGKKREQKRRVAPGAGTQTERRDIPA